MIQQLDSDLVAVCPPAGAPV